MKSSIILFLLIAIFNADAYCHKTDSLRSEINRAFADTTKARLYIELGREISPVYPDSAIFYFEHARSIIHDDNQENLLLTAKANISEGFILYRRKNDHKKALELFDSTLVVLNELENSFRPSIRYKALEYKVNLWNYYGDCNRMVGEYDKALFYYKKALELAQSLKDPKDLLEECYMHLGNIYRYLGNLDKAMEYNILAMYSYEKKDDKSNLAAVYNNIGNVYHVQSNFPEAIRYYQKALNLFEEMNDKIRASSAYYNIGVVHYFMKNYDNALDYTSKSMEIREEIGDKKGISNALMLMGVIHQENDNINQAVDNYEKALQIAVELNDMSGIGHGYMRLGNIYKILENYDTAINYYENAFDIFERTRNFNGLVSIKNEIADIYYLKGDYSAATEYAYSSFELSEKIGALAPQLKAARILMMTYKKLEEFETALDYSFMTYSLRDSIFNEEKSKEAAELEAKYQTEKKQLEIENLRKEKALSDAEIARQKEVAKRREEEALRQRVITYSLLAGLLIVLGFSYLLYRQYKHKKEANILLAEQNIEINQKNEEIRTQRDEITTQRDFAIRQKDLIEASHQRITDSINYAKLIQSALLPAEDKLKKYFPNHFVYYKPRDIVSGDFFWVKNVKHYTVIIAADCTGHGVPGAFMSVLGIAFLNEIIRRDEIIKASDILENLRNEISGALDQSGHKDKADDGMDMSVLFIDNNKMKGQFAGAKSPLYIIRSKKQNQIKEDNDKIVITENKDDVLIEIKGDAESVSLTPKKSSFTNREIDFVKDDSIYLFSDGFIDQINSKTNRRFTTNRFKNLMLEMHNEPVKKQYSILEKTYESWRNGNEQIDDILVLGIFLNNNK